MQFLKHFFLANVLIGNEKATLSKYRANPFVESISINAMRVHIFAQGNNGSHWWGSKSRLTEHHQLRACRTVNHYVTPTLIMFQSERLERWRERESGRAREREQKRERVTTLTIRMKWVSVEISQQCNCFQLIHEGTVWFKPTYHNLRNEFI